MERYLSSGLIKGIGKALAHRIVKRFGAETFDIIEKEPDRLAEVNGISEKKAREIYLQVCEKKDQRDGVLFLSRYGISNTLALRIWKAYGSEVYRIIRENPYRLADELRGGSRFPVPRRERHPLYASACRRRRKSLPAQGCSASAGIQSVVHADSKSASGGLGAA